MASETTSDVFPKVIPHEMLQHIAAKVGEPAPFEIVAATSAIGQQPTAKSELSPTENTFTRIICNVLTGFWRAEHTRFPSKKPSIKYQIIGSKNDRIITLVINYVKIIELADCEAVMRSETRLVDLRFQFTSLLESKALKYGCVSVDISCTTPIGTALPYSPVSSRCRRTRTMQIDWSKSVVLQNDKKFVTDLIDDVYNMQELMPTDIKHWLEPIYDANQQNGTKRYGNGVAGDHEDSDDTGTTTNEDDHGRLVGYCLSFTNLPSFNLSFLTYLQQKYTRSFSALLLFPNNRATQRLAISISCETALVGGSTVAATGSKRLKKIIDAELHGAD